MNRKIKAICPTEHGGCGREHFLEVSDNLDEEGRAFSLQLAKMTGCRPCSIWQESRHKLEDVRRENNKTIWEQDRRRENFERLIARKPANVSELESKIAGIDRIIDTARADLLDALRQISALDDARAEYLSKL